MDKSEKKKNVDGEVLWNFFLFFLFFVSFFTPLVGNGEGVQRLAKGLFFFFFGSEFLLYSSLRFWCFGSSHTILVQNRRREMKTTREENPVHTFNLEGLLFFGSFVGYGTDGVGAVQYNTLWLLNSGLPFFFLFVCYYCTGYITPSAYTYIPRCEPSFP